MAQKHDIPEYPDAPMTRASTLELVASRRQVRSDAFTSAKWAEVNPILQLGEIGYETDTNKLKVGDGVTEWNNLGYIGGGGDSHNKGYFATQAALEEAHPTAEAGDYAIVGATDTVWVWDEDTSAWKDSDQKGQVTSVNGQTGAVTLTIPDAVQYSTMPTASADNLGDIVQFTGTTDANYTNGYFYKCVSDGQEPATYSWSQVSVQPAPSGLPDQTGQSGKFLTTDGTDASWSDKPLVNTATGTQAVAVVGTATGTGATSVGLAADARGSFSLAAGWMASSSASYSVALGARARATAIGAIQLNSTTADTTNSDTNTFKVANANGNFEIMSADGTIPEARLADTTGASQGDVLQLDSNGNAVWAAGGGGTSYSAGTGIDITSGTISVTSPTLKNVSPDLIDGLAITNDSSHAQGNFTTVVGIHAMIPSGVGQLSTLLGANATSVADNGIAIGWNAKTSAQSAIQIGSDWSGNVYDNQDANTLKVGNNNGNFMMMDANGNLPADRLASTTGLADGNYRLRLTMASGVPTLSWVAE